MTKRVVYLAGPYTGDVHENIKQAMGVAEKLWRQGYAVICPHGNTAHMSIDDPKNWKVEFATFLTGDLEFVQRSDILCLLPGWMDSRGACAEWVFALYHNIPVYCWHPDTETMVPQLLVPEGEPYVAE